MQEIKIAFVCELCGQPHGCVLRRVLLDQGSSSSSSLEMGTPSASDGPVTWLPVFWLFNIVTLKCRILMSHMPLLIPYHPARFLCEGTSGHCLQSLHNQKVKRSIRAANWFANQDDGSDIYSHCAAALCFDLVCTEFEVVSTGVQFRPAFIKRLYVVTEFFMSDFYFI